MTYELCLEYGTYPLSRVDAYWGEDQNPPTFIQEDRLLCHKLETMNHLFHDLFVTIESQFHYVGFNMPEKRAYQIRLFYMISIHLEGIEPPSQEPESYVISITLKVVTTLSIPL